MENIVQEDLCKGTIRSKLEQDIAEFNKVILVYGQRAEEGLANVLYEYKTAKKIDTNVLILSSGKDCCKCYKEGTSGITWRYITESEMQYILKLYFLYEFSDRIILFSQESIFGCLLNYVNTGILTIGDLVQALL